MNLVFSIFPFLMITFVVVIQVYKEMDSKLFLRLLMISENIPRHNGKKCIETRFWMSITTDTHFVILDCQKCPPETAPAPGLFYKFWTQMPNPPMRLYCIARPRNFFQLFSPHFLCKSWNHFVQFKKYTWRSVAF